MKRKLLISLILLVVAVALAFALYYVFFKSPTIPTPVTPPGSTQPLGGGSLTPSGAGTRPGGTPISTTPAITPSPIATTPTSTSITSITTSPILSPTRSADGKGLNFYNPSTGQFMHAGNDGTTSPLSDKVFYNVSRVTWSPKDTKAILEYPDGAKTLYNFDTKLQVTLPSHWQSFEFAPSGNQIAFLSIGAEAGNRWLAVANDNGSSAQAIEPLGDNASKVIVSWSPNDHVIAFSKTPSTPGTFDDQEVLLVGKNHENFKSLHVNGIDFNPQWSPDGNLLLYSVTDSTNQLRPRLWVTRGTPDTIGQNKTPLPISTWADKCTFATATIAYCAVPTELPDGAGLLREVANSVPDNIYRIDIANGATTLVATPEIPRTISEVIAPAEGNTLFIRNQETGQLESLTIK